jgi:protein-S-isoprenylcysteine O-methyltransferase Ste14
MICGVLFVLLGESALTASVPIFHWYLIFAVINAIYIPLLEEPILVNRFHDEYLTYRQNVPRWIPTLSPWEGESSR